MENNNMKKLRSKATVGGCTLSFAVLLLVLLLGSINGETVRNRRKQLEHERTDRRSMRSEGDGDLRPGSDGRWSVAVPLCAEDEYMDVNVQACSRCSEVCRPNIDLGFCASKCPEYFRIHFDSSNHPEMRHSSSLVTIISSPGGGREELLTEKPLFWTSIVSMTIAAAATTAIIVLCIRRRKPRGSLGGSVGRDENSRERTLSETSDDRDPEHRTLLRSPSGRESEWNRSCRDERIHVEEPSNRSMYTTGGGGGGGHSTTDRFGGAICNQNDHSNLLAMPCSPDPRDRCYSLQKVLQTHFIHSNHILGINSTTFCQDPAKDNIWISQKQIGNERSPSFSMHAEFLAENEKQLQTASGTLSTRPNAYSQETSYESLMHEVSRKREESLPYFQQEDETCVKENRAIDLQVPREGDFSMEPKAMGILVNDGNLFDDIKKLQVSVRMTTKGDSHPADHCAKAKATLYNLHSACYDGITTCTDEPN